MNMQLTVLMYISDLNASSIVWNLWYSSDWSRISGDGIVLSPRRTMIWKKTVGSVRQVSIMSRTLSWKADAIYSVPPQAILKHTHKLGDGNGTSNIPVNVWELTALQKSVCMFEKRQIYE